MRALGCIVLMALLATSAVAQGSGADPAGDPKSEANVQVVSEEARERGLDHEIIEWEGDPEEAAEELHLPGFLPGHGWVLSWGRGIQLTTHDNAVAFQFGGRLLVDAGFGHLSSGLEDVVGDTGWDADGDVRQARLYGRGVFLERFFATAEVDVKEGVMRDVFWGIRGLGPLGTLQVGFMTEPFSLEEQNSTLALPFLERSVANVFSPSRGSGLSLTNTYFDKRLRWEGGAFFVVDGFNEQNENEGFDGTFDVALRVTGLPIWREDESEMLLFGFSYAHRFNITDPITFATRPESSLAPLLADTGSILDADSLDRGGFETAWSDGRRTIQAELLYTRVNRSRLPALNFWGGYIQASMLVTDDVRHYGRKVGAFGRIVPREPFDYDKQRWGAVEVAARLSVLDLDDEKIRGGRLINGTLGVSWFPFERVRLAANYVLSHRLTDGFANIVEVRLQLDI